MREQLAEALPLTVPFLVQMFPAYACNFRCSYCIHAVDIARRGYISDVALMNMSLYEKALNDIAEMVGKYGRRLKMLRYAAWGEPLIHKNIAKMVELASKAQVADSVEIVTNGSLLTEELSDSLIAAGLNKLRVSLEGLSSKDYLQNCGVQVDFERMVENLRYFYEHRNSCKVYIKIIDYMLKSEKEKERFYDLFCQISDNTAIECLYDAVQGVDYQEFSGKTTFDKGQNAQEVTKISVCPQPYYMLQINPDGNVIPCCAPEYPEIFGNVNDQALDKIWNGAAFNRFRLAMLDGAKNIKPICSGCKTYIHSACPEDNLDSHTIKLKKYFERLV